MMKKIANEERTMIFYESPVRLAKNPQRFYPILWSNKAMLRKPGTHKKFEEKCKRFFTGNT